jgi:hypothetical protein
MIAESALNVTTAHAPRPFAPMDVPPNPTRAVSSPERGHRNCPMCMDDAQLHVFYRAIRDAVDKNPRVWQPLERGLFDVIRENPFNTGSVGDALEEMVHRNPRLLSVLERLLNGPHTENDWLEPAVTPGQANDREGVVAAPLHAPVRPLATASHSAPTPPTPQNATLGNTVAVAAVATDCNIASTEPDRPTPQPATACSDYPTAPRAPTPQNATVCSAPSSAPPDDPPYNEPELRKVYGDEYVDLLTEVGKSAHWDALEYRNGHIREAQAKGGRVPLAWYELPPQETTDPTPSKLKVKQQVAISALLGGASQSAAAEAAGIDRSTLYRWMKRDAEFVAAYNRVKHDHYDAIHARMFEITNQMMDTLENLLKRPFSTTSDRLRMISVGLQLRKQIMAQRAPDCPTDAKFIENTWRGLGVDGPYCHEFSRPSADAMASKAV